MALLFGAATAQAQLQIEIVDGNPAALPIAVVPFEWQEAGPPPIETVDTIVANDLYRSGLFDPMAVEDMPEKPSEPEGIRFGTWRLLKVDYIVVGKVRTAADGMGHEIIYQLFDVHKQEQLLSRITTVGAGDLRFGAHRVADAIYEKLTGVPGAFSTRIAYVTATGVGDGTRYELVVADADGYAPQSIVGSPEPLLSPSWSPDGRKLAYVSFEQGNSAIYVQDVATGARELISSGRGINGAPAFSPDGRKMALTLSRSGNPEIYVRDMATGRTEQLTSHWSIDTEPAWFPDSKSLVFTSSRSGKPQLYEVSLNSNARPERLNSSAKTILRHGHLSVTIRHTAIVAKTSGQATIYHPPSPFMAFRGSTPGIAGASVSLGGKRRRPAVSPHRWFSPLPMPAWKSISPSNG